jgi:hypothetical protein
MCRVVRDILRVLTSRRGGTLRVLRQTVLRGRVRVGMLRRGRALLVLLVHYARRSRLLEVVRRRTLLGVVGVMVISLNRHGDTRFLLVTSSLSMSHLDNR